MAPVFPSHKLIVAAAIMLKGRGPLGFRKVALELGVQRVVNGGDLDSLCLALADYVLTHREQETDEGIPLPEALVEYALETPKSGDFDHLTAQEREDFDKAYERDRQRRELAEATAPKQQRVEEGAVQNVEGGVASTFDGRPLSREPIRATLSASLPAMQLGGQLSANLDVGPRDTYFDLYAPYGLDSVPQLARDLRGQLDIALRESDRIGIKDWPKDHNQRPPDILTDETKRAEVYAAINEIETLDPSAPDARDRAAAAGSKLRQVARQFTQWAGNMFEEAATTIIKEVAKRTVAEALIGFLATLGGWLWRLADMVMQFWRD